MVEEKKGGSPSYDFPLNQGLLDDSLKLKEERRILKERLQKIESNKEDVSQTVYEKVHADYDNRLQNVNDQLLGKKQDIDRELAALYETRDKIQGNLKNHKNALEEIQFRHKLGEFNKQEYQKRAKGEEDKVTRFEQVLAGVNANIKRYEGLFEGEEDLFGMEQSAETVEEMDEWEEEAKQADQLESEAGNQNGGDAESGKEWMDETRPNLETTQPQLTIISGKENVGKTYPIAGSLTIGRSHTNQITLKDAKVSRQHAEIKLQGSECLLIDLNSSNGTHVNGHKIHEQTLSPNDEIQIGDFVLQYQH